MVSSALLLEFLTKKLSAKKVKRRLTFFAFRWRNLQQPIIIPLPCFQILHSNVLRSTKEFKGIFLHKVICSKILQEFFSLKIGLNTTSPSSKHQATTQLYHPWEARQTLKHHSNHQRQQRNPPPHTVPTVKESTYACKDRAKYISISA